MVNPKPLANLLAPSGGGGTGQGKASGRARRPSPAALPDP